MDSNEQDLIEGKDTLSVRNLINKITYHWPLFLLSVLLCLTIGVIYFRYAIPVYEVKASIIIKDERKDAGYTVLKELDLADNSVAQETEMEKDVEGIAVKQWRWIVRSGNRLLPGDELVRRLAGWQ